MLCVHGVVHLLHLLIGDLPAKISQRTGNFRMPLQCLLANDWDSLIRREVMTIIFERHEIKSGNKTVGGIASGEVDLAILQRPRQQPQIHDSRLFSEM